MFHNRRDFILSCIKTGLGCGAALRFSSAASANDQGADVAVTRNGTAADLVRSAVDMLGGMHRFVRNGQFVLIKPNIGWDRLPEQAANTNPEMVAAVVGMCIKAGAKRVRVLDRTCNQARRCYMRSGIEKAARAAGAEVRHVVDSRFQDVPIPQGELVKSWPFYRDAIECDVLINMPVAKSHSVSRITLGFKNMMGVLGGNRGAIHKSFMTKIVDINQALKPNLTIIDAYRVLFRNGPTGGSLADVAEKKVVIAGTDRVAVDAYGASLFDIDPNEIEYLKIAAGRGMGEIDLSRVKLLERDLSL